METLRWMRIIGDTIFLAGVAALAYFTAGIHFGWSYEKIDADETDAEGFGGDPAAELA
jgi:nitric oxide reductase subunit B